MSVQFLVERGFEATAVQTDFQQATIHPPASRKATRSSMQPIIFDGCFGWLHVPPDDTAANFGVLLCRGPGADGLRAHRSFRLLGDTLANAGLTTLRFDYPGTGDSRDIGAAAHWTSWLNSIHVAADLLRELSGAERIVLCGLGLGATLAAVVAAHRMDVAALVLLTPVLLGRSFVSQLNIEAKLQRAKIVQANAFEVHGLNVTDASARQLGLVDLRSITFAGDIRIAIYTSLKSRVLSECVEAWSTSASVDVMPFSGLEPMLRSTFMSHEPLPDVARIATWIARAAPPVVGKRQAPAVAPALKLHVPGCTEEPVRFGPDGDLFGILCRPSGQPEADLVVVIGNAGGDPHYGYARGTVSMARQLARAGYASLRMDFAGLGDSMAPDEAGTHVFETDRRSEIAAAIDTLASNGYRRFAVLGLCSGAYHAFHAALADARVSALLAVNLPMFEWDTNFQIELLVHTKQGPRFLMTRLLEVAFWKSLVRGRVEIRNHLAAQAIWLANRARDLRGRLSLLLGRRSPLNFAQESMRVLSHRTRTLFLLSADDTAVTVLAKEFGRNYTPPGATIKTITGLDHTLSDSTMQGACAQQIIEFLSGLPAPAAPPATL